MSINSNEQFKRVCIENNYTNYKYDDDLLASMRVKTETWHYEYELLDKYERDGYTITRFDYQIRAHHQANGNWKFEYKLQHPISKAKYESMIKEIKNKCNFYKVVSDERTGENISYYNCPDSKDSGKIGFGIFDNEGIIRHNILSRD